jgi:hypothetical protein
MRDDSMIDRVKALKARRVELERQIAALESDRVALYMPGIHHNPAGRTAV